MHSRPELSEQWVGVQAAVTAWYAGDISGSGLPCVCKAVLSMGCYASRTSMQRQESQMPEPQSTNYVSSFAR